MMEATELFYTMSGYCFLHSETGTEGGWWAMQEDGFPSSDGIHQSYYGLRYLEEGDEFTVYGTDGSVLWSGVIHKDTETGKRPRQTFHNGKWGEDPEWQQQVVGCFWVHWVQAGIDPEKWGELFEGEKGCMLRRRVTPEEVRTRQEILEGYAIEKLGKC